MIKLVIFDIGNVILRFDHRITCKRLAPHSPYNPEEIYSMVYTDSPLCQYEQGQITSMDFFRKLKKKLDLDIGYEHFYPIWSDIFTRIEGMEEILFSLESKVKLYVLSNTDALHFKYLKNKFSIFDCFNQFILSYVVGACKPDKKIYQKALTTAGVEAHEAFFTDDIAENVTSFLDMGGKGTVFQGPDKLKESLNRLGLL